MKIKTKTFSGWKLLLLSCVGLGILFMIAGAIVISLIALYLPSKGDDLVVIKDETNAINMAFATDFRDGSTYSIAESTLLAAQINQYLNSPLYKLLVRTASFVPTQANVVTDSKKKRKRQIGGEISCDPLEMETNENGKYGDRLIVRTSVDQTRSNLCPKQGCTKQHIASIKSKIQLKLRSMLLRFQMKLNNGSENAFVTAKFCSFGSGSYMSPKPRALVSVDTQSVVGVLFDDIPEDARAKAKQLLDEKNDTYWKQLATQQLQYTQARLVFRPSFYSNVKPPEKRGTLSLTLPQFFEIHFTTSPYFTTIDGHTLYVRNYTSHNILLTDQTSLAESDDRLAVIGGSIIETFSLPVDPFLLLQRTGFACIGESLWPPLSVDPESTEYFYDETCAVEAPQSNSTLGCLQCHCTYPLPTLSCIDAVKEKIGLVIFDLKFTRITDDPELARQWRFPPDGPSINSEGEVAPMNLFEYEEVLAQRRFVYLYIDSTGCELVEQCVTGSGWRRLLVFSTTTPNYGIHDFHIGRTYNYSSRQPTDYVTKHRIYEYSPCHKHFHFSHYIQFAFGRKNPIVTTKRGFCLQTTYRHANAEWSVMSQDHYTCANQGIAPGWSDTYQGGLRCQWIDVTTVNTSASTHTDEFSSILNPDGFLCEGVPIDNTWLTTNFTTTCCHGAGCCGDEALTQCCGGLPVEKQACTVWSDASKDNGISMNITVPKDGEGQVTADCQASSGKWGEKRDCGFRLHPRGTMLTCSTPGGNAVLTNVTADTFFQIVRVCEASILLNSCLACIWNSSLTTTVVQQGQPQEIHFTCTPQRDAEETGGKFCIYVAPLFEEMDHEPAFVQWSSID